MKKSQRIGEIIQELRKKKDMTQEELAQKSGVSYTTLIKIERGSVQNPTVKTIKRIADALDASVDLLLGKINLDNNPTNKNE
ncbi:MAG TPA: helix-turn-helix transcriptional regulator [Candidatus Dojkabacteria bacterium]|nr:helix-turn-helix transcriptional regulator [Candidatus Dojkabacteria bacterium]